VAALEINNGQVVGKYQEDDEERRFNGHDGKLIRRLENIILYYLLGLVCLKIETIAKCMEFPCLGNWGEISFFLCEYDELIATILNNMKNR
jgi:hypothetical protein